MSAKHDFGEYPPTHFDEHAPTPRPAAAGGWWIAAVAAVIAVVGVIAFLSGQPPASAGLQATRDGRIGERQTDNPASGPQLAAAHAAKLAQAATQGRANTTEAAALAGAASAGAAAQNASATEPAPKP